MIQNKILLIAGMHRSGTSLTTQWLSRCGLSVGENLLGVGIGNEDGHFEDIDFYDAHMDILKKKFLHDSGFVEQPVETLDVDDVDMLRAIIDQKNQAGQQWGWKDPRTCLFLREYELLLPDARFLIVFRDWRSTVSSMISRIYKVRYQGDVIVKKGLFKEYRKKRTIEKRLAEICRENATHFLKVWMLYNREILASMARLDTAMYAVVNFQSLLEKDRELFYTLTGKWNFDLDYIAFKEIYKPGLISREISIDKYLDHKLLAEADTIQAILEEKASSFFERTQKELA